MVARQRGVPEPHRHGSAVEPEPDSLCGHQVESVKLTSVELEGPAGACNLPFSAVELQLLAAELGPATLATGKREGECLTWTLATEELGPWFRQPKISIVALVDGEPVADTQSLSLRVSFLVDV